MTLLDLKRWIPGPELIAKMLGDELADYGIKEESK